MPTETTCDTLRNDNLIICQPAQGYRFSMDSLLLAAFARVPERSQIVDLGTGCGVMPLVLARRYPGARFVAMENNREMAGLAVSNVQENGLQDRIEVVVEDVLNVRSRFKVSSCDLVISNPPFRNPTTGKVSPYDGRDAARHETTAGLSDFLAAAKYLAKPGSRICFIYHPSRLAEFISIATEMKLALLRLRMVHGTVRADAKMFLAELAKGRKGEVIVEAPLIVYDDRGEYSAEAAQMMGVHKKT
jgi:tRNA1Val (adenine37-N6)-methyltransferase